MRIRFVAAVVALMLGAPAGAHATHLGTGRPDCRTKVPQAKSASMEAGEVKVLGWGASVIIGTSFPGVAGVTPTPREDANWDGDRVIFEGDVVAAVVAIEMIGMFGGGHTTFRRITPAGQVATQYSGAQRFDAISFTGHYRIKKLKYFCESVVRARTVIENRYYEIELDGYRTPTTNSALKTYGQATFANVEPGDVSPR